MKINNQQKNTINTFIVMAIFLLSLLLIAPALYSADFKSLTNANKATEKLKMMPDELIVKFKESVSQSQQIQSANMRGDNPAKIFGKNKRFLHVKNISVPLDQAMASYANDPSVEYVQPNYIYHATAIPDDTNYDQLWGLANSVSGFDIDAELAWEEITDCRSVITAVLDTGIDYTHPDLAANMWDGGVTFPNHGYDFIDVDNDPRPVGGAERHGSHVAGTIGAVGNNDNGSTGVCWQASIMSVRVLDANGSGSTIGVIQGIEFAADNGAKVINMSLGAENPLDPLFRDAISYAQGLGVVVVVAAGNGGSDGMGDDNDGLGDDGNINTSYYPCNFNHDNLVCVAALDQVYSRASFSNYGATSVDVGAPGTNIYSTYPGKTITDDLTGWTTNNGVWSRDTTCLTTPILANPANWCGGGTYELNADDRAYKAFDLTGTTNAELSFIANIDTESGADFFRIGTDSSMDDPFDSTANDTLVFSMSGTTTTIGNPNGWALFNYDQASLNCGAISTCSIGFQLTSNATTVSRGVAIAFFEIDTLNLGSNLYKAINGTSMASPHVAGIATMIRAFNPDYTYQDTVAAIKSGGEITSSLSNITSTGKAANAMGSLSYINAPSGISTAILP